MKTRLEKINVPYTVWTNEDGPMKRHRFLRGVIEEEKLPVMAKWFSEILKCYVQLHDRKGSIVASAGTQFDE